VPRLPPLLANGFGSWIAKTRMHRRHDCPPMPPSLFPDSSQVSTLALGRLQVAVPTVRQSRLRCAYFLLLYCQPVVLPVVLQTQQQPADYAVIYSTPFASTGRMKSKSAKRVVFAPPDTLRVSVSASHVRPLPQTPPQSVSTVHELSPLAALPGA
jgi:hypothetical protein